MFRMLVHQTFRVELHSQQKRQPVAGTGLEFLSLDEAGSADHSYLQEPHNPCHSLMMCVVHTQCLPAYYLGW